MAAPTAAPAVAASPAQPKPASTPSTPPGKDPVALRQQYQSYLVTCDRQNRAPAVEILSMIHRLFEEKPPEASEEEMVVEIRALETRFGIAIHSGGGMPAAVHSASAPPPTPQFATAPPPTVPVGTAPPPVAAPPPPVVAPVPAPAAASSTPPEILAAATASVTSAIADAGSPAALQEALARLAMSPDIAQLTVEEREALIASLVQAMI